MRYLGGKSKIRKELAKIIHEQLRPGQTYFEPFVGGGWVLQEVKGRRVAADKNAALITMYKALQSGWEPPADLSEAEYASLKAAQDVANPRTAFAGVGCSFAGKWFDGYARDKRMERPYAAQVAASLRRQTPLIKDVLFLYGGYSDFSPSGCLIYCDPPYAGTTGYTAAGAFDSAQFWATLRRWARYNTLLISEYAAPSDFKCIWEGASLSGLRPGEGLKQRYNVERLYTYAGT